MVEEEKVAEAEVKPPAPEAPVDPQKRLEEALAQNEKLNKAFEKAENERRSALGQIKKQEDFAIENARLRRHLVSIEEKVDLFLKATLDGDTESVRPQLESLKARRQVEEQETGLQQEVTMIYEDIAEEIRDCGLDPLKPTELFAPVSATWNEGLKQGAKGLPIVREALKQAKAIRREFVRTQREKEKAETMKAAEEKAKEINRKAGVYNTESPPAVGSGSDGDDDFLKLFAAGKRNRPADFVRAQKILG